MIPSNFSQTNSPMFVGYIIFVEIHVASMGNFPNGSACSISVHGISEARIT